jgi:DMSO/TMAO reductase YedYZ molybdopterin-dependent catalytic subunit
MFDFRHIRLLKGLPAFHFWRVAEKRTYMKTGRGFLSGVFVAAMLTSGLVGVFYFGWAVIGLPFLPFDLFDAITRLLPGGVVALGISTMVAVIRGLNIGPTSEVAKLAEQSMAVIGFFLEGVIFGSILFWVVQGLRSRARFVTAAAGTGLGAAAMLISIHGRTSAWGPGISGAWVLLAVLVWSCVISWAATRLTSAGHAVERAGEGQRVVSVERLDRRRFLIQLGGSAAVITVAGAVIGKLGEVRRREAIRIAGVKSARWSANHALPNADASVQPAPGTRREFTPLDGHYRIDINTIPPAVDEQTWRLKITGLVETAQALTLQDLRRYEPLHQFVTLSCISNPVGGDLIGTTRWSGVSLKQLLTDLKVQPAATHFKIHAADDFYEIVSLETIRADPRVMLAYDWDGVPLTREHGFPLRIYIPDLHGMKQPKWIDSIEVIDHWEPGYWVKRGWDKVARMKTTSVIDTIAVDMTIIDADQKKRVPIGGIAHAGARGISKVEVRMDDGPWESAALRAPLSDLTWVIWRYDWPFQPGKHIFTVRCFDENGTPQIETQAPPDPSGSSGLHSKNMMV